MANSIVDNEYPHSFGSRLASFDDASSTLSDREDFLLVLVSSLSASTSQDRNQKRALAIIEACGVHPEVLDAADPANTLVRDELCEMSGIRGVFPQFFLVQGDKTSFFADFTEVENMNEEGTLVEWLSMELPIAKSSSQKNLSNDVDRCTNTTPNDDRSHISQSHSIHSDTNADIWGIESDHEYASSSTTEDLLNVASVTKILNSFDTDNIVPDEQLHRQEQHADEEKHETDDDNKDMLLSIPTITTPQDEWSDPLLLERYEDEILALEDYLQEREEEEGESCKHQQGAKNRLAEQKREAQPERIQQRIEKYTLYSDVRDNETQNVQFPISRRGNKDDSGNNEKNNEKKDRKDGHHRRKEKCNSISSLSSTGTTATITPTSSLSPSQSPDIHRLHKNPAINNNPSASASPSPSPLFLLKNKNKSNDNDKEMSCNVSMETVSTRSETEQLLQAEVDDLKQKCEKLTAERYIIEGQLKEARQSNKNDEQRSSDRHINSVPKFQLQHTMRCTSCTKVFKSNPSSLNAPIASQACGHSICKNCCHKRLSGARRRHRDENTMNSSERLRNTISSDLFMCGMGDMSQVYSPSFDEHQRQTQECESCPICCAPRAFRHGKLYVNESLCIVLKLLDN